MDNAARRRLDEAVSVYADASLAALPPWIRRALLTGIIFADAGSCGYVGKACTASWMAACRS